MNNSTLSVGIPVGSAHRRPARLDPGPVPAQPYPLARCRAPLMVSLGSTACHQASVPAHPAFSAVLSLALFLVPACPSLLQPIHPRQSFVNPHRKIFRPISQVGVNAPPGAYIASLLTPALKKRRGREHKREGNGLSPLHDRADDSVCL